jgi:VTC domain
MQETHSITSFLEHFAPITLIELNKKAAMLERMEQKYILSKKDLSELAIPLAASFDILEIDHIRDFLYETVYFDTIDHRCFREHQQGKRIRFKARTRKYVDA